MNRKFLIFALIAIFAIVSLGIAFASDNDNTFKVSDVEFHIPDGYHITNNTTSRATLENDNGQTCSIEVSPGGSDNKLLGTEGSVGEKQGVCRDLTSTSTGETMFEFIYNDDSHLITIKSPDRSTAASIIG